MPRPAVTRDRLLTFLREAGRRFHGAGRLYLVGGSQMVLLGFRSETEDVDYMAQIDRAHDAAFTGAVRALIREMQISVEPAGPADFIPLPTGWEERSRFIGRYGDLDVFTLDPVSTALSKIERGTDQDIDDALQLVTAGYVTLDDLRTGFADVLPRLERESVRVDEADFRRKFNAFLALAQQ